MPLLPAVIVLFAVIVFSFSRIGPLAAAPRFVLAPAAVVAPVPPWAMSVTRSATGPMKTSFVPDVKLTALPELLDDRTVVRVSTDADE